MIRGVDMDEELRRLINNLTEDIIRAFNLPTPITDIDAVVQQLGGRVVNGYNSENMSSGSVQRENNGFVIFVSPFQNEERRTFTIAHELGHLFLHMGYRLNQELWDNQREGRTYYRSGNSLAEYQANEFAAAFLMPREEYKRVMDENTEGRIVETRKIAEYFHVSVSAASNRGKFLGYLQW